MAWLEGTAEREFEVEAPVDRVAEFFADPGQFEHCVQDLDALEQIDEDVWQFTLEELSAKGVSFQGEYRVAYSRDGSEVIWEPTDADKNMKSEGRVTVEDLGGGRSHARYEQTISVELPIPGLMTKVFNPIVDREVRKSIDALIECAQQTLEGETD